METERNIIEEKNPGEPLDDGDEYRMVMQQLGLAAGLLADLPLQRALALVRRAESIGPLLAPSEWMYGGATNLEQARRLLEPAVKLALAVRELRKEALERAEREKGELARPR